MIIRRTVSMMLALIMICMTFMSTGIDAAAASGGQNETVGASDTVDALDDQAAMTGTEDRQDADVTDTEDGSDDVEPSTSENESETESVTDPETVSSKDSSEDAASSLDSSSDEENESEAVESEEPDLSEAEEESSTEECDIELDDEVESLTDDALIEEESGDTEMLGGPTEVIISINNDVQDHNIYVNLTGGTHETIKLYLCDSALWPAVKQKTLIGSFQYDSESEDTKANTFNLDDIDVNLTPGIYYIRAMVMENPDDVEPILYTSKNNNIKYFLPEAPKLEDIEITPATRGKNDGSVTVPSLWNEVNGIDWHEVELYNSPTNYSMLPTDSAYSVRTGVYLVRYSMNKKSPWLSDGAIYIAHSEYTKVIVPLRESGVTKIEFMDRKALAPAPMTEMNMFKGQTDRLSLRFNEGASDPDDNRVTYKSSYPKVLTVDAAGNIKAIKEGNAEITVTSLADEEISAVLKVHVNKALTMKLDKKVVNSNINDDITLAFNTDTGLGLEGSDFSVVSSDADIWDAKTALGSALSTYDNNTGKGSIVIKASDIKSPGTFTVTVLHPATGQSVSCDINFDGVRYTSDSVVAYKGGKRLTGWIYIDADGSVTSAKNKASKIYYVSPDTYRMSKGIVKLGKQLYCFAEDNGMLVNNISNVRYTELAAGCAYIGKDGKVLTGWHDDCYYDPITGYQIFESFVPYGKGQAYVDKEDQGGKRFEEGFKTINLILYYFSKGVIKTGWIYLDGEQKITTKNKASVWLYADPVSGRFELSEHVMEIGSKSYYMTDSLYTGIVHGNAGFYDADKDGHISAGDYYIGADGVIIKNKSVNYNGDTYYLDKDGHLRQGIIFYGSKAVYIGDDHKLLKGGFSSLIICGEDNTGTQVSFGSTDNSKGEIVLYTDSGYGTILKNEWLRSAASPDAPYVKYYYAGSNGKLVKGFKKIGGYKYYFDETTGELEVGRRTEEGRVNSVRYALPTLIKGKLYYLTNKDGDYPGPFPGKIIIDDPGWKKGLRSDMSDDKPIIDALYYIDKSGIITTGFKTIDKKKYYFNESGEITVNDFKVGEKVYCIDNPEGTLIAKDTVIRDHDERVTYVINKDGSYKTGWIYIDKNGKVTKKRSKASEIYWADVDGRIIGPNRGIDNRYLVMIDGKLYCFGDSGLKTGWQRYDGSSTRKYISNADGWEVSYEIWDDWVFYFDPKTGAAVTGWQSVPELIFKGLDVKTSDAHGVYSKNTKTKYYFAEENDEHGFAPGALVRQRTVNYGKKIYCIDSFGRVLKDNEGWDYYNIYLYILYRTSDGQMARGRTRIGDVYYYFDPDTGAMQMNCIRKSGKKWYTYDNGGCQTYDMHITVGGSSIKGSVCYKKDGSISGFIYEDSGKKVKNTYIIPDGSNEKLYIGKNGMPKTGVVINKDVNIFTESDGELYKTYNNSDVLIKKDGKYYLVRNGALLTNGEYNAYWNKNDFSLSPGDRRKLLLYNKIVESSENFNKFFKIYNDKNGAAITNAIVEVSPGVKRPTTSMGVILDEKMTKSCYFYKYKGKWYVTDKVDSEVMTRSFMSIWDKKGITATIRSEKDGTLIGVYDENGKPVNGTIEYTEGGQSYYICLKNGKPATGRQKVTNTLGKSFTMTFDPDLGLMYEEADINVLMGTE